jgi:hypothetical protein
LKDSIMQSTLDRGRLWRVGAVAAAAGTIVNLVQYGIARAAGVDFTIPLGPGGVLATPASMAGAIVFNSLALFALGLLLTSLVARRAPQRLRTMQIVAAVVMVLSFAQPLLLDAEISTRVSLTLMHLPPGAAFIMALQRLRTGPRRAITGTTEPAGSAH